MGIRLYTPTTGRFLTQDPIYGGNATTYGYPAQPTNKADLDGRLSINICVLVAVFCNSNSWPVVGKVIKIANRSVQFARDNPETMAALVAVIACIASDGMVCAIATILSAGVAAAQAWQRCDHCNVVQKATVALKAGTFDLLVSKVFSAGKLLAKVLKTTLKKADRLILKIHDAVWGVTYVGTCAGHRCGSW